MGLRLKVYGRDDALATVDGPVETIAPGESATLSWDLPDTGGQPIQQVGFVLGTDAPHVEGAVLVDYLRHDGSPVLRLRRPDEPGDFWRQAWVNGVSFFSKNFPAAFRISQSVGEGMIIHGTRDWRDYEVSSDVTIHLARDGGVAVRVQGLRRYYALVLSRDGRASLRKVRDDLRTTLAETPFVWSFEHSYAIKVAVRGRSISCTLDGRPLFVVHDDTDPFETGGIGLMINEGALSTQEIRVDPA